MNIGLSAQNVVRRDGQGRVMLELARELVARGHDVSVYAHTIDDELRDRVRFVAIRKARGPQIVVDAAMFVRTTRRVRRAGHDVVCVLGPCALPRAPFVYNSQFSHRGWRATWTAATRPDAYHRLHARLAQMLETFVARRAQRVIASSARLGAETARPGDPRIVVVPNGIDLDEFRPYTAAQRDDARAELGVPDGRFVLAFLGDYTTTRKGLEPLLQAMALGPGGHAPDGEHLLVAARGPNARTAARATELGIGERVGVLGFAPPRTVMAAADVVCVPSLYEPWSLVGVEAAASARPVVISEVAGAAPFLGDGAVVAGPAGDPHALRKAIDTVPTDPDGRARMGAAGRQAASNLSWSATMSQAAVAIEATARKGASEVRS